MTLLLSSSLTYMYLFLRKKKKVNKVVYVPTVPIQWLFYSNNFHVTYIFCILLRIPLCPVHTCLELLPIINWRGICFYWWYKYRKLERGCSDGQAPYERCHLLSLLWSLISDLLIYSTLFCSKQTNKWNPNKPRSSLSPFLLLIQQQQQP